MVDGHRRGVADDREDDELVEAPPSAVLFLDDVSADLFFLNDVPAARRGICFETDLFLDDISAACEGAGSDRRVGVR